VRTGWSLLLGHDDLAQPVEVERDGVAIQIEHPDSKSADATVSFSKVNHVLVQKHKDFEAAQGWLTVSPSGAFATTWQLNASSAETQLFRVTSLRGITEHTELIPFSRENVHTTPNASAELQGQTRRLSSGLIMITCYFRLMPGRLASAIQNSLRVSSSRCQSEKAIGNCQKANSSTCQLFVFGILFQSSR
jgi:hypothetical protein